ncbi:MAG: amino acid adenylation domain-containing protein, partial [Acidobacteriota bacterium]
MKAKGIEAVLPALPVQEDLLLHGAIEPESADYCIQVTVALEGALDPRDLERAWRWLASQHAALRLSFAWKRVKRPLQVVHEHPRVALEQIDLSGLSSGEVEERVCRELADLRRRGFDPAVPPLIRLTLLKERYDRHLLVWSSHRLALDRWSVEPLLHDLLAACGELAAGRTPRSVRRRSLQDYVAWWRKQDQAGAKSFWKEALAGYTSGETLSGMTIAPARGAASNSDRTWRERGLAREVFEALRQLTQRQGLSLETVVEGAWALVLQRYGRHREVIFGSAFDGRPSSGGDPSAWIGPMGNTLPVPVRVEDRTSAAGWLRQLESRRRNLARHQHSSLEQIRSWSGWDAGQELFDSGVHFPKTVSNLEIGRELSGRVLGIDGSDQAALTLEASNGDGLTLRAGFESKRLEPELVERMLSLHGSILGSIAEDPERPVAELPWRAPEELERLAAWNQTWREIPLDCGIHQLFELRAEQMPDAIAVSFGRQLSYQLLNRWSQQVAKDLWEQGVVREERVGILLDRCVELVVAQLAVLKAGAVYVPLDPAAPAERTRALLEDSDVRVLLSSDRFMAAIPDQGLAVLLIDRPRRATVDVSEREVAPNSAVVSGEQAAYVIYTSGSTGRPKGVVVSHQAINRLVVNTDYVQVEETDRVALAANPAFDAATFEIWAPLVNGARLVGIAREVALSPREFVGVLRDEKVSTLFLTTALFNQLVREAPIGLGALRHLLFGGEAVDPRRVRELLLGSSPRHAFAGRLLHVYGPTETTTFASWHRVTKVAPDADTVPIGGPIANTTIYVLDASFERVPMGLVGQLCIGGSGLARGYLQMPARTARSFVPDPFAERPGGRLYCTGDLCRQLSDGSIEFIGRADFQVKLRGFRIELGEIESALLDDPTVQDAIVLVREDQPGEKSLVACVTGRDREPSPGALRERLGARLPEYMVPSA